MFNIGYSIVGSSDDETIVVFVPGGHRPLVARRDHPNYQVIVDRARAGDPSVAGLFDVSDTVKQAFGRLTDRITVKAGEVFVDGDPVHSTLTNQILDFVRADEDFQPLLRFYEKLESNPLGDVRQGLYDWITGQTRHGALTITEDGDVIGYKGYQVVPARRRTNEAADVYVSSRPARDGDTVNDVPVPFGEFAEHLPGDVVEMPRSVVLHEPSAACGTGLHVGTYAYASTYADQDGVMSVVFDPRDVVSLPDSTSSWKLRVRRYVIIEQVTEPYSVPVYQVHSCDDSCDAGLPAADGDDSRDAGMPAADGEDFAEAVESGRHDALPADFLIYGGFPR